jgi:hypothetical protein
MACLLDDAIVVSKASLESMFNEELVELRKGLEADLRSTDRHRRARRRVEHPRRHDDRRTGLALNEHDINPGALLRIEPPDRPAIQCVPPVMDPHNLPDTGRITPR